MPPKRNGFALDGLCFSGFLSTSDVLPLRNTAVTLDVSSSILPISEFLSGIQPDIGFVIWCLCTCTSNDGYGCTLVVPSIFITERIIYGLLIRETVRTTPLGFVFSHH